MVKSRSTVIWIIDRLKGIKGEITMPDNDQIVEKPIENFEQTGEALQTLTNRIVGLEIRAAKNGKVIFPRAWFPPTQPTPAAEAEEAEGKQEA